MKKHLALLLAVAMLATVFLTACGSQKATETTEAATEATTEAATPATKQTITYWNIATDEPDKTIFSYAVDK